MTKVETAEQEKEIINAPVPVNEDKIDALIAAAEKIDALGKALDKFRTFVLQRALPGDWVSFKEKGSDEETLELIGAATDRIAAALGVSFVDWRDYKESGNDEKGAWYIWYYECTTTWQGRRIERVTGRAGSRDRFFGMAHGALKPLADVNEGDIRTAARRNCMKEGVKLMLGLRRIPKSAAAKMGLDVSKVRSVEFTKGDKVPPKEGAAVTIADVTTKKLKYKNGPKAGQEFLKYIVKDSTGFECSTLSEKVAELARIVKDNGERVILGTKKTDFGYDLLEVKTAPQGPDAEAGDAQEPA